MTHCPGQVLDAHGAVLGYFEYDGRIDVARPKIFLTDDARGDAWRQPQPDPCTCHGSLVTLVIEDWPEDVPTSWAGRTCLDHGFIVHGAAKPYPDEEI